jgi:crotonobetainyl-CoA:carnitine CoA-transferase CaiB-like acyl-CoA transferase
VTLPLTGVTVVEIAANLAGPFAAEILAHMGADVVKVERPDGGDDARGWGPPFWRGDSPAYLAMNANKRSITVDLKDRAAVAWLADFIASRDVLVQNLRPGVLDDVGLGPEAMLARNPRLVYCSLWAFGSTGPLKLRPGYEPMVQAFSGLMSVNGDEDSPPTRVGTSILDFGTGMWAAMGVLGGLVQRAATGRGCVVDTSLFETALGWLTGHFAGYRASGELPVRHRTGSRRLVVFEGFETKNGPIIIAAGNDRLFAKLAVVLGRPEWATDPRFATNAQRIEHREEIVPEVARIVATRTKGEWIDRLEEAGVPCAPIHAMDEALTHPQAEATGMIVPLPELDFELMGLPMSFDGQRPGIRRPPPRLGQHNDEVIGPSGALASPSARLTNPRGGRA